MTWYTNNNAFFHYRRMFEQNVQRTLRGHNLNGVHYEKCSK